MISGNKNDGRSAGLQMNDSRITSQVKEDLNREQVYKFNSVDVKTYDGVVQLSGFVDSEQQKARAGQLAQSVQGVTRVDNGISVKPEPTGRTNGVPVMTPSSWNTQQQGSVNNTNINPIQNTR